MNGSERAKAQRPATIELLPEAVCGSATMELFAMMLSALVTGRPLERCVEPVATVVDGPDCESIRNWAGLHWHAL